MGAEANAYLISRKCLLSLPSVLLLFSRTPSPPPPHLLLWSCSKSLMLTGEGGKACGCVCMYVCAIFDGLQKPVGEEVVETRKSIVGGGGGVCEVSWRAKWDFREHF